MSLKFEEDWLKIKVEDRFLVKESFIFIVPFISNLLRSLTLIAYILKSTLIFFKWLKMSDTSDKTL